MSKIERAKLLATFVHLGQKRQDGEDYINHCRRVVESLMLQQVFDFAGLTTEEQDDMICAAWLHDTLEDSFGCLPSQLIFNYFGNDVIQLVKALTHQQSLTGESYMEYIERVSKNPKALQIKFQDLIDNTAYKIPEKQCLKYRRACIFLRENGIEIPSILKERLKV